MIGTSVNTIDSTTNTTKMPTHTSGAAQKMRQLSPHHAAPSPAPSSRGGGAGPWASSTGAGIVGRMSIDQSAMSGSRAPDPIVAYPSAKDERHLRTAQPG